MVRLAGCWVTLGLIAMSLGGCPPPAPEEPLEWGQAQVLAAERDLRTKQLELRARTEDALFRLLGHRPTESWSETEKQRARLVVLRQLGLTLRIAIHEADSALRRRLRTRADDIRTAYVARVKTGQSVAGLSPYVIDLVLDDDQITNAAILAENDAEVAFWRAELAKLDAAWREPDPQYELPIRPDGRFAAIPLGRPVQGFPAQWRDVLRQALPLLNP